MTKMYPYLLWSVTTSVQAFESTSSRAVVYLPATIKGETVRVGDYRVNTEDAVTLDVVVVDVFESILDV